MQNIHRESGWRERRMILWFIYPQFKPASLVVIKWEMTDEGQTDGNDMGSVATCERIADYMPL